jgi:hypothetical protein
LFSCSDRKQQSGGVRLPHVQLVLAYRRYCALNCLKLQCSTSIHDDQLIYARTR